jgi:hypothetical protein
MMVAVLLCCFVLLRIGDLVFVVAVVLRRASWNTQQHRNGALRGKGTGGTTKEPYTGKQGN